MYDVSSAFKEKANQAGREVFCKIIVGSATFLDDAVLDFDFDDVNQPDWFTFGTTCSNRFSFSVKFSGEMALRETVRPYVSFDGEEWCPLGIFYVARRIIREKYATFVCYDKFYLLDEEYSPSVELPNKAETVLKDVCEQAGLTFKNTVMKYDINSVPEGSSIRDVIGYIAGVNHASAKINREGELVFRYYNLSEWYYIFEKNCTDYSRGMSPVHFTKMICDTGDEVLTTGTGAEVNTIEMYNPFMTQGWLDLLLEAISPITIYDMDIEMQGMPFLESGDLVQFLDLKGKTYPLCISEMELHYDGGLTARIYSRTRNYTDAAGRIDDLEYAIEELRSQLGNICIKQSNKSAVTLGTSEVTAADFEFTTKIKKSYVQVDINFTIESAASRSLYIDIYVNGVKKSRQAAHIPSAQRELLHYYYLADELPKGKNHIIVKFSLASGSAVIPANGLAATLVGKGMGRGGDGELKDRLTLFDKAEPYDITSKGNVCLAAASESAGADVNYS